MTTSESQCINDSAAKKVDAPASNRSLVDMSDPAEVNSARARSGASCENEHHDFSKDGYVTFHSPYSNHDSDSDDLNSNGSGKGAHSQLGSTFDAMMQDIGQLKSQVEQLTKEVSQVLQADGTNGQPAGDATNTSGDTALTSTTVPPAESSSATTTPAESTSTTTTAPPAESTSATTTSTASDGTSSGANKSDPGSAVLTSLQNSDSTLPTGFTTSSSASPTDATSNASTNATTTATATDGSIPGVTSANNAALAAANPGLAGQGTGSDALFLGPINSSLVSINENDQGFSQQYGYFEADMKTEAGGAGAPGWWLESLDHAESPSTTPSVELDILEAQTGVSQTEYYGTIHKDSSVFAPSSDDQQNSNSLITGTPDLAAGYNVFGLNWQPNDPDVEWYLNGKEVSSAPKYDDTDSTPVFMNIGNSAASWGPGFNPQDVTASNSDPSQYASIKWARVYQDASLINNTNDPGGTLGTTINDSNPADAPPDIAGVNWVNTFNYDFTNGQTSLSDNGGTDNTVWTDHTQDLPEGSWWQQGIAVGPASVGEGTTQT